MNAIDIKSLSSRKITTVAAWRMGLGLFMYILVAMIFIFNRKTLSLICLMLKKYNAQLILFKPKHLKIIA